jgi:hypothetical protein
MLSFYSKLLLVNISKFITGTRNAPDIQPDNPTSFDPVSGWIPDLTCRISDRLLKTAGCPAQLKKEPY